MALILSFRVIAISLVVLLSRVTISIAIDEESEALLALKASMNDPLQHLVEWKEGDVSPCSWTGVGCGGSSVTSLNLSNMNLSGVVSAEIANLRSLVNVSLDCNNFTGNLPVEIATLTNLQYLNVSTNSFHGNLTFKFSQLQQLRVLDCFNNYLSGPLPPDLWKVSTLQHLSLGGNYFEGRIPPEYGAFPNLVYLGLNGNSLTGPIPSELGNLTGMSTLEIYIRGRKCMVVTMFLLCQGCKSCTWATTTTSVQISPPRSAT